MKVVVAGSRGVIVYLSDLSRAVDESGFNITELVSGHSGNVDLLGEVWATLNNIPVKLFQPLWNEYGRKAGVIRNQQMAEYADGLIALWDGQSRGTLDMIRKANRRLIPVFVKVWDENLLLWTPSPSSTVYRSSSIFKDKI